VSLREGKAGAETRADLERLVARLAREVEGVEGVNERFKSFNPGYGGSGSRTGGGRLDAFLEQLVTMAKSLASDLGKQIRVETGNEVGELPRLSDLSNSVLHLVRNAIDHGLEEELDRVGAGKDGIGLLRVRFRPGKPGEVLVEVEDDGRGIDFGEIRRKAIAKDLLRADEAADQEALLKFLFMRDFSLKGKVTELSGRGVGLDVVKDAVMKAGGTISVRTERGKGTKFTLRVPLGRDHA